MYGNCSYSFKFGSQWRGDPQGECLHASNPSPASPNLQLKSGILGWVFNTPQWHQLHHSVNNNESSTNPGYTVIFWDRLFGRFSGKESIGR
jgi:hypothetical protein